MESPKAEAILAACQSLNLPCKLETSKRHPHTPLVWGRVRVDLSKQEPKWTKKQLFDAVASKLPHVKVSSAAAAISSPSLSKGSTAGSKPISGSKSVANAKPSVGGSPQLQIRKKNKSKKKN